MTGNKLREELAQSFLSALKQDQIPWRAVWNTARPYNCASDRSYRGVNNLNLSWIAEQRGYKDPRWCTFRQAQENGWKIRKGEHASTVEYWAMYDPQQKKLLSWADAAQLSRDEPEQARQLQLRCYFSHVFNGEQIAGIPALEQRQEINIDEVRQRRDTLLQNMELKYREEGDRAYYSPGTDTVMLPPEGSFEDVYGYMCTFLHECGHATGAPARLNRDLSGIFGSPSYAREELRAEIASAFTAQGLGLSMPENALRNHMELHKAYIQSWVSILEEQPNELFAAIKDANGIADYLVEKGEFLQDIHEHSGTEVSYRDQVQAVYEDEIVYGVADEKRITKYSPEQGVTVADLARGVTESMIAEKYRETQKNCVQTHQIFEGLTGRSMSIDIYQLRKDADRGLAFTSLRELEKAGINVSIDNYELVYHGELQDGETLEGIYERFNINQPKDFTGHSLSISDVVVIDYPGSFSAYYCDRSGFKEMPEITQDLVQWREELQQDVDIANYEKCQQSDWQPAQTAEKRPPAGVDATRVHELRENYDAETNDPDTQDWRNDLTPAEEDLIKRWDKQYDTGVAELARDTLKMREKAVAALTVQDVAAMRSISPALVDIAKKQDVLDILRRTGEPLIHKNNEYRSAAHDSLVITEGKGFYWFSHAIGSKSPIDYFMWTQDMGFVEATKKVLLAVNVVQEANVPMPKCSARERHNNRLHMLPPAQNNDVAFSYLTETRKLDKDLVSNLIKQGLIYQSQKHNNVIFVGKDYDGKVASGFARYTEGPSADGNNRFDVFESNKNYRFRVENPNSSRVNVFESEIDLLSYLSMQSADERQENYISLGGVSPRALLTYLDQRPDTQQINICTDNDKVGEGFSDTMKDLLNGNYEISRERSVLKDWNEDLQHLYQYHQDQPNEEYHFFQKDNEAEWEY